MIRQGQVLHIEPHSELKFVGPFNQSVTSYIKLTNPTDRKVMFKIKTTAPKKYCVRPNSGLLQGGESQQIAISLQPFLYDPAEKNKHKFMVQTVFAPETGDANLETLWKEIGPDQLMDSKLKCVFEMPQSQERQVENEIQQQRATIHHNASELNETALINDSVDLQKAAKEIQALREEESALRQVILRLKEEKLELQIKKGQAPLNRYSPPEEQTPAIPTIAIVFALVAIVVGIIFGKFLL